MSSNHPTPKRLIGIYKDILRSSETHLGALPANPVRRDYFDLVYRYEGIWSLRLKIAGLQKRHALGDADKTLAEAHRSARTAAKLWKVGSGLPTHQTDEARRHTAAGWEWNNLTRQTHFIEFRFATAVVLELITHKLAMVNSTVLELAPKPREWLEVRNGYHLQNFFDAALLSVLLSGRKPKCWDSLFEYATKWYGSEFVEKTWNSYLSIVKNAYAEKWAAAIDSVESAGELFLRRRDPRPDAFGIWECCGQKGQQMMDLRLSALIAHCFPKIGSAYKSLQSVHKWS